MSEASGHTVEILRVDGGASAMDVLLQFQADQLRVPVTRPVNQETTAFGAAYLAGLAEGVWSSLDEVTDAWHLDARFDPEADPAEADAKHAMWLRAVDRSRGWVAHQP
jgi:glycerol kinase